MQKCKACEAKVEWKKVNGKWSCENPDGSDHWDLCSKRKFERIKRTGEYFETPDDKGYFTDLKSSGIQYVEQSAGIIRGDKFRANECDCVPWELCEKKCKSQIARI